MDAPDGKVGPEGGVGLPRVPAAILAMVPLVAILFYGVAGEDKFLLLSPLMILGYAGLAGGLGASVFSRKSSILPPPAFAGWMLFLLYGTAISLSCPIPYEARIRLLWLGLVVGCYLVWSNSWVLFRHGRAVIGWVLLFALLVSFYGLINFFKQPGMVLWTERYAPYEGRLASTYICPNHFAHFLQMLLPFCLVLPFIPQAGLFLRLFAGYCGIVFIPVICLTESRAGMLGAIAALCTTMLLLALRRSRRLFLLLAVVVPVAACLLLVGAWRYSEMFQRRMKPVVEFVAELKTEGFNNAKINDFRPLTWLDTIDMVKEQPATGFGPGSYRYLYPEYRNRFRGTRIVTGHPHNEYLEIAVEYGLLGFGLFALAWCCGLVRLLVFALKTPNRHHAFMAMAFLGTAAGTMVHAFFDFEMHVFQNALVFALLAGIAAGPLCGRRQEALMLDGPRSRRLGLRIAHGALASFAAAAFLLVLQTYTSAFIRAVGDLRASKGQTAGAKEYYRRAVAIDPANWRAYKELGFTLGRERYYNLDPTEKRALAREEAEALEAGYRQNPSDAELVLQLGKVRYFLGEVDGAIDVLKQAAALRPFNDICWWELGVVQRKAGRYHDALATFHRAASIRTTPSTEANIRWIERQLNPPPETMPVESPGSESIKSTDLVLPRQEAIPLDKLLEMMESQ